MSYFKIPYFTCEQLNVDLLCSTRKHPLFDNVYREIYKTHNVRMVRNESTSTTKIMVIKILNAILRETVWALTE